MIFKFLLHQRDLIFDVIKTLFKTMVSFFKEGGVCDDFLFEVRMKTINDYGLKAFVMVFLKTKRMGYLTNDRIRATRLISTILRSLFTTWTCDIERRKDIGGFL